MPERAGGLTMTKKGAIAARTAAVKRCTFTREFKLKVIREVEAGRSQAQVAREYQITENTISKLRRQHRQYQDRAFAGRENGRRSKAGNTNISLVQFSGMCHLKEEGYTAVLGKKARRSRRLLKLLDP